MDRIFVEFLKLFDELQSVNSFSSFFSFLVIEVEGNLGLFMFLDEPFLSTIGHLEIISIDIVLIEEPLEQLELTSIGNVVVKNIVSLI